MTEGKNDKPRNVLGQDLEANRQTMRDMDADLRQQAPVPLDPLWVQGQLEAIRGVPSPTRRRTSRRWIPVAASLACLLPAATWLSFRFLAPASVLAPASAPAPVTGATLDNATAVALLAQESEPKEKRHTALWTLADRSKKAIDLLKTIAQEPTDPAAELAHAQLLRIEQTLVERPNLPVPKLECVIGVPGTDAKDRNRSLDARKAYIASLGDFAACVVQTVQDFDPQGISLLDNRKQSALRQIAKRFDLEPTPDGQAPFYVPIKTGPQ